MAESMLEKSIRKDLFLTGSARSHFLIKSRILDNGIMEKCMALANTFGKTVVCTMASICLGKDMGKASMFSIMANIMKVTGVKESNMGKVSFTANKDKFYSKEFGDKDKSHRIE